MLVSEQDIRKCGDHIEIKFKNRYGDVKGIGKIDKEDLGLILNKYVNLMNNGYISVRENKTNIGLHRILMKAKSSDIVDHINGIRSDNRKCNLRILDNSKNGINRSRHKNNHSGHRGVFWNDKIPTPKWMAYITVNWKRKHLGFFERYEDAVLARLKAEKRYYNGFTPSDDRYELNIYKRTEVKYKNNDTIQ